ncbi:hydantoinase B/oxoprolinase family protein [Maridesulfovibrio sp.]|uniref:hydantoinase B/oxoprolinase family protein n=1 Tax=Maridesulfovibrio sp. TaxID=2795000 RepID=UPI002A18DE43|nr:hydantoinase B/oxoprolinase family protein [Maridesulfovibrio sp.]
MKVNPILLEVFKNRFAAISEEMGVTLTRTAFSPNIKERRDLSCAVFDGNGDMVAQAAHIPVHLGSMPLSVKSAIEKGDFSEGDMIMLNDPFKGGTHLPDITLVAPVFCTDSDKPAFYVANRAHHSDVGGMASGSMPLSTSLYQEGIIIPPVKIVAGGEIVKGVMDLILNNVRTPVEREGDFSAQIMANITGVRRLKELIDKYGLETVDFYAAGLNDYAEAITRKTIESIPDGTYSFTDYMDGDGVDCENVPISVVMEVKGDSARLDFTESGNQVSGSVNAVRSITLSAVLYVFRSLIEGDVPTNAGILRPIEVLTRKGSILDANFPAAVAGGNVETSQRIVDVVLGALAEAVPQKIPAASQGTMNNMTIGGMDERTGKPFAYYETLAGGMGASPNCRGEHATHSHMTNTLNTPVEALEYSYPFRVRTYCIRKNTGGTGRMPGGDGLVREIELLSDCEITVLSERRVNAPYGLQGGGPGTPGRNLLVRDGKEIEKPGKFHSPLKKGDIVRMETPGGGGWGK